MILNDLDKIVANLPYGDAFKFVDKILEIGEEHIIGVYRFRESEYFYTHHFINHPVTPGFILSECMAQIALACYGTYLGTENDLNISSFALSEQHIQYLNGVAPNTTVIVSAKKEYFRFNKLKMNVQMMDENEQRIAIGWMSGMLIENSANEK